MTAGAGVLGVIKGDIGAVGAFETAGVLFVAGAQIKRRCYEFQTREKDLPFLAAAVCVRLAAFYTEMTNLPVT